ncbi:hypothetical protein B0H17DRAFT_1334435 [Mycena rosella]|uniref:Uncharacterized protein n=1 Tax=Mycena rosella TaxID=1033263 RepID=A0AAD7GBZ1_MYCRO|nr:hypothetical protein B0H17DRAFT_1334435 [Mycena rosella]
MLATAWATLVHRLYTADEPATLGVIALPLLALSDMKDPQNLAEVVDGCGGSYKALALTLMQNISQAVANSKSEMAVTSITPILLFLSDVSRTSPDFVAYLLSHGIISSLVSALDIDGVPPPAEGVPDRPVEVELCLGSLIQYLNVSPGYPWTVQALQAGLLRRIITSSAKMATASDAGKYPKLLGTVLPRSLVFYPVIAGMKKSFFQLETLSRSEEFSRSVLYGLWNVLKALVDERVKVLDTWEASGRASSLACDNMKRADWIDGHRDECHVLLSAHLTYAEIGLHYREKSFIRALLHSDYQRLRVVISIHMLQFMTENPGTSFFVAFDYTGATGVELSVLPVAKLGPTIQIPHWGRLARAGGRLTLHAIRIGHGANWSNAIFPLRATSSQFSDGLVRIASGINGLQYSQVEALVRDLIETTDRENTEIH